MDYNFMSCEVYISDDSQAKTEATVLGLKHIDNAYT